MGYKVYAGGIETVSGHPEQIRWVGRTLIHDSLGDAILENPIAGMTAQPYIKDGKVNLENLEIPQFTFTVPARMHATARDEWIVNPYYDSFVISSTFVSVIQDNQEEVFFGCVTEVNKQFDLSKEIVCKGLEYLMSPEDHVIYSRTDNYLTLKNKGESYTTGKYPSILGWSLAEMHFLSARGTIQYLNVDYTASTIDYLLGKTTDTTGSGDQVDTKWNTLQSLLFDEFSGYFRLYRVPVSGNDYGGVTKICCYYSSKAIGTTNQTIEFGRNLLDATMERNLPSDYVTRVTCHGTETVTKGWWIFKKTSINTLTATAKNESAEKKYGMSSKLVFSDEDTTQSALQALADKTLKEYKQEPEDVLTIEAFDRKDAGESTDRLGFLKKTHILSQPHGLDGWYICTKEELYIDHPDQTVFTYGLPPKKLLTLIGTVWMDIKKQKLGLLGVLRHLNG